MTNIAEEIRSFLDSTGIKQIDLSRESGVPCATINMLIHGKRKNLIGYNQDAIREAMSRLRTHPEAPHGEQ